MWEKWYEEMRWQGFRLRLHFGKWWRRHICDYIDFGGFDDEN